MNRKLLGTVRLLGIGATLAAGIALAVPAAAQTPAPATPATPAPAAAASVLPPVKEILADRVLGDPKAPVTIYDYSSMTCPHCADFTNETLPELKKKYIDTGKVKLIFRDFPLDQLSLRTIMMVRCAPVERFYPLVEVLYKSQAQWVRAADPMKAIAQYGKLAGMKQETIDTCVNDKELADGVLNSRLEAQSKFNVEATPTFIFNDGAATISGAQPIEKFSETIDKLLKK